uniref:Uncharacterized protein n=1 Tax=Tetraselmis sp. GSL018 TaxID=582737 RepID=A0A061S0H5_9CHLO|mmetsp:Transcript_12008/g.28479  ORF Transcript_12008/g.28479 Transcript_12008/m.28479 type:complete len:226 (+) Transcript_12008:159-836(+)
MELANFRRVCCFARVNSSVTGITPKSNRPKVYVYKTPLIGLESLTRSFGSMYPRQLKHSLTVVVLPNFECEASDFLPRDPTSLETALKMLAGQSVEGHLRRRKLRRLPTANCWYVGECVVDDPCKAIDEFNRQVALFSWGCFCSGEQVQYRERGAGISCRVPDPTLRVLYFRAKRFNGTILTATSLPPFPPTSFAELNTQLGSTVHEYACSETTAGHIQMLWLSI